MRKLRRRIRCRRRSPGSGFVSSSPAAASGIQGGRHRGRHPRLSPPRRRESAAARRSPQRADDAPSAHGRTGNSSAAVRFWRIFHYVLATSISSASSKRIGADHEVEFVANATIRAIPVVRNGGPRSARPETLHADEQCVLRTDSRIPGIAPISPSLSLHLRGRHVRRDTSNACKVTVEYISFIL